MDSSFKDEQTISVLCTMYVLRLLARWQFTTLLTARFVRGIQEQSGQKIAENKWEEKKKKKQK